ncbi:hypothetical protein PoB_000172600 [Plakobranchus ocellatus]|uniref:Uncharacterized protein n=1 Tax=Plakobranchus ocellatus TaxID=259542 RepID=A0AAV3XYS5_9GAST|nr:hypothetical protein PoB_000172600 [Plakobranchus ocellatus]
MYLWGVGGTVASKSTLRSAGILLSRVQAPPPAPRPDGGPENLRSPYCGQAVYKKINLLFAHRRGLEHHVGIEKLKQANGPPP